MDEFQITIIILMTVIGLLTLIIKIQYSDNKRILNDNIKKDELIYDLSKIVKYQPVDGSKSIIE